jgi:hypothetical protein
VAPPPADITRSSLAGIAFLAAADAAYNAYGATNSSPQTTELFAADREVTLMKWVHLGGGQALLLTAIGAWLTRSVWPLVGGGMVIAMMHASYLHACRAGKRGPGLAGAAVPTPASRGRYQFA